MQINSNVIQSETPIRVKTVCGFETKRVLFSLSFSFRLVLCKNHMDERKKVALTTINQKSHRVRFGA